MAKLSDLVKKEVAKLFEVKLQTWKTGPADHPEHGVEDRVNEEVVTDKLFALEQSAKQRVTYLQGLKVGEGYSKPHPIFQEQMNGENYFKAYFNVLEVSTDEIKKRGNKIFYNDKEIV